ncbi:DUF3137 domain-containing protein [Hellea balneolensis]|uniref:DUF3137 domain-containing protein n=1 Tax=Hellea balneolensis TaxID=287478 RepID=UPI00041A1A14|nr:DUF3137 domain-containing protein [Hellea balneolensis]
MHSFNEHHAELKGFSEYYHETIFPLLAAQDGQRREALSKAKLYGAGIIIFALCIAAALYLSSGQTNFIIFILFGSGMGVFALYTWLMKSVRGETKDKIVGGICTYVGWTFQAKAVDIPDLALLSLHGLMPKGYQEKKTGGIDWNAGKRASFEDQMSGEAHGAQFTSVETHLERKSDDKWVTAFRGQLMTLTFPRQFLGTTVVLRDKGMFQRKKRGDMKRVGLVDPVFEKIFEAYSTDQVESRYLLDPVFMQKLVDLERSVDGKNIRFGFLDGKLFIVVETPNRFEAGSMLKPLTAPDRTQKILDEVGAVYDIVDGVMKPRG